MADTDQNSDQRIDVLAQQVGSVYAQALYGAAESRGEAEAIVSELDTLVREVLDKHGDFEEILGSEMLPSEEKTQILDRVLGGRVSELLMNFLKVLARKERLGFLRPILSQLRGLHNEKLGHVRVDVTTATPMPGALTDSLRSRVRDLLGREPELVAQTDPRLIGGVLLRVGDTVYDGSVSTQLEQMRGRFCGRSTAEIEAGRDRFQFQEKPL